MVEANFPLIPLHAVLFPGSTMTLHVFEKRYRQMMAVCLDRDAPFGIVLIREGKEVGGPCVPHPVGTTARVTDMVWLPDGRMNLTVVGVRRFRIRDYGDGGIYPMGLVEYLEEPVGRREEVGQAAQRAAERYASYLELARSSGRSPVPAVTLPEGPVHLSYAIARGLAADLDTRQRLLEAENAAMRLIQEAELLEGAQERLRKHMEDSGPEGDTEANGA